jgi:hypothetical protein
LKKALSGALYGIVLCTVGVMAAGGGHGTYIFLTLASAPVIILGVVVSLLAAPILWFVVGWLLNDKNKQKKIFFLAIMSVYYISAGFLLIDRREEWQYMGQLWKVAPLLVTAGWAWYLTGQIVVWIIFFKNGHSTSNQNF